MPLNRCQKEELLLLLIINPPTLVLSLCESPPVEPQPPPKIKAARGGMEGKPLWVAGGSPQALTPLWGTEMLSGISFFIIFSFRCFGWDKDHPPPADTTSSFHPSAAHQEPLLPRRVAGPRHSLPSSCMKDLIEIIPLFNCHLSGPFSFAIPGRRRVEGRQQPGKLLGGPVPTTSYGERKPGETQARTPFSF